MKAHWLPAFALLIQLHSMACAFHWSLRHQGGPLEIVPQKVICLLRYVGFLYRCGMITALFFLPVLTYDTDTADSANEDKTKYPSSLRVGSAYTLEPW